MVGGAVICPTSGASPVMRSGSVDWNASCAGSGNVPSNGVFASWSFCRLVCYAFKYARQPGSWFDALARSGRVRPAGPTVKRHQQRRDEVESELTVIFR
jgi:hypothetical protein